MGTKFNKILNSNAVTIFLFGYGLIVQIVAFETIYFFIANYPMKSSVVEAFVFLWYCIPVVSVFSIIIAFIQIKRRRNSHERYRTPLIGLILNLMWLVCYLFAIYLAFADQAWPLVISGLGEL